MNTEPITIPKPDIKPDTRPAPSPSPRPEEWDVPKPKKAPGPKA